MGFILKHDHAISISVTKAMYQSFVLELSKQDIELHYKLPMGMGLTYTTIMFGALLCGSGGQKCNYNTLIKYLNKGQGLFK